MFAKDPGHFAGVPAEHFGIGHHLLKLFKASEVLIKLFANIHKVKDLKAKTAAGLTRQSATVFEFGLPEPIKTLGDRADRGSSSYFFLAAFLGD